MELELELELEVSSPSRGRGRGRGPPSASRDEVGLLATGTNTSYDSCCYNSCGPEKDRRPSVTPAERFLLRACVIVGGGGFVFGYNIGVMSGALAQLEDQFALSNMESGLVMSALALGSVVGCVVGGTLCDSVLGRWWTIQLQNAIFLLGTLLAAVAPSLAVIILGRFIVGVACSLSAIADIPYLLEVAPPHLRGRVSSSYEMLVVVGVVTSFGGNLLLTDLTLRQGWRYMLVLPAPLVLLQIAGMMTLPESPKFLLDTGRVEEARVVLRLALGLGEQADISGRPNCREGCVDWDSTLDMMIRDFQRLDCSSSCHRHLPSSSNDADIMDDSDGHCKANFDDHANDNSHNKKSTLRRQVDRIKKKSSPSYSQLSPGVENMDQEEGREKGADEEEGRGSMSDAGDRGNSPGSLEAFWEYRTALLVVLVLMIFQQFTGGVVVRNYAPKIFNSAGFGYRQSLLFNLALGGMKVGTTAMAIFFVDSLGRKPLLLGGIMLTSSGMLMLTLSFAAGLERNIGIFLCAGLLITAGYSAGFGPVCWVLQSESFPTAIRGRAMAVSVLVSNLGQFVMNLMFPLLMGSIRPKWIFCMFFLLSMLALLFVSLCTVETKGKQPKEILAALHSTS